MRVFSSNDATRIAGQRSPYETISNFRANGSTETRTSVGKFGRRQVGLENRHGRYVDEVAWRISRRNSCCRPSPIGACGHIARRMITRRWSILTSKISKKQAQRQLAALPYNSPKKRLSAACNGVRPYGYGESYEVCVEQGLRCEASPDLSGQCSGCFEPMIARCGNQRIWLAKGSLEIGDALIGVAELSCQKRDPVVG